MFIIGPIIAAVVGIVGGSTADQSKSGVELDLDQSVSRFGEALAELKSQDPHLRETTATRMLDDMFRLQNLLTDHINELDQSLTKSALNLENTMSDVSRMVHAHEEREYLWTKLRFHVYNIPQGTHGERNPNFDVEHLMSILLADKPSDEILEEFTAALAELPNPRATGGDVIVRYRTEIDRLSKSSLGPVLEMEKTLEAETDRYSALLADRGKLDELANKLCTYVKDLQGVYKRPV